MVSSLLFSLILSVSFNLEANIKKLNPEISQTNLQIVNETIINKAYLYGFAQTDHNLILAMIKKESNFSHIFGQHGEVGMLQVIPEDSHILSIISHIVCEPTEKYCLKTGSPDIYTDSKINSYKARKFISEHPKYALEVGFGEMKYWKEQYVSRLKNKYWTKFPRWYLQNNLDNYSQRETSLKWWWQNLMNKAGDEYVWISHYNWGNRLSTALSSRNYAIQVLEIMENL